MQKAILSLAVGGALLVSAPVAMANQLTSSHQNTAVSMQGEPQDNMKAWLKQLNMTDDQRKKINVLMRESTKSSGQYREQIRQASQQLKEAIKNPDRNKAQIDQLTDRQSSAMSNLMALQASVKRTLNTILTPEQHLKLRQLQTNKVTS